MKKEKETELEWFPFKVDKFLSGTASMTASEIGGYLLLLCEQWKKGFVPDDIIKLKKISRLTSVKQLQHVLLKFVKRGDKLINLVCEETKNEQLVKHGKRQKSGSEGAKKRWQKDSNANGNAIQKEEGRDNIIINNNIIEEREEEEKAPSPSGLHQKFLEEFLNDTGMKEALHVQCRIEPKPDILKVFNAHLFTEKKSHETYSQWCSHLRSWINRNRENLTAAKPVSERMEFSKVKSAL